MKGSPPAVFLQVITVCLIWTMVFLTLVSAENMETFNKRFTGRPITFTSFATTIPFAASSPVGAGLNHGGTEGSLIHTHLEMETTPSLLPRVQLMLSSATSLQVQAMPITPTLTPTADAKSSTNVVGITTNCYQDNGKTEHNINTTMTKSSIASAATAPINSTLSLASFTGKGKEQEEEQTAAKTDTDTSLPLHPTTKSGTKSSTTVAADKTTDKTSTRINNMVSHHVDVHKLPEPTTGNGTNHLFDQHGKNEEEKRKERLAGLRLGQCQLWEYYLHYDLFTTINITSIKNPTFYLSAIILVVLAVIFFSFMHFRPCMSTSMILNEKEEKKVKVEVKRQDKLSVLEMERRKFVRYAINSRRQRLEELQHSSSYPDYLKTIRFYFVWFLLVFNPRYCEAVLLPLGFSFGDGKQNFTESSTITNTDMNALDSDEQHVLKNLKIMNLIINY